MLNLADIFTQFRELEKRRAMTGRDTIEIFVDSRTAALVCSLAAKYRWHRWEHLKRKRAWLNRRKKMTVFTGKVVKAPPRFWLFGKLFRWTFLRCAACGNRFRWNQSWYFRGKSPEVYHFNCK